MSSKSLTRSDPVCPSTDLVYGRHDGGAFDISAEEWRLYREEHSALRLFFLAHCSQPNSPNGVLANYRSE